MRGGRRRWLGAGILALGLCFPAHGTPRSSVLFDEGHGQRFVIDAQGKLDLSGLAAAFRAVGAPVHAGKGELTDAALSTVGALVVSGPFEAFPPAEVDAVMRFLDRGGRLAVMLHIPFPVAPLLRRLRVDFSNGVIRERQDLIGDDQLNFRVTALTAHALTQGLASISVFGAWALLSQHPDTAPLARTSPSAWVDLNRNGTLDPGDAVQSFSVAVTGRTGRGRFVVFGDDALFQNQFLTGGNAALAKNLARWLTEPDQA